MTFCFLLICSSNLFAQDIEIPEDLKLETDEDYKGTEPLVIDAIEWLQNTPITQNPAKRKEVNAFLFIWVSGSPTVSIQLVSGLTPTDCAECLLIFMGGWTKYSLENDYSDDNVLCALAGVEAMIELYEKNKSTLGKQSDIEKMIKRKKKGKLKEFVASQF